jgi:hypothetical protein
VYKVYGLAVRVVLVPWQMVGLAGVIVVGNAPKTAVPVKSVEYPKPLPDMAVHLFIIKRYVSPAVAFMGATQPSPLTVSLRSVAPLPKPVEVVTSEKEQRKGLPSDEQLGEPE